MRLKFLFSKKRELLQLKDIVKNYQWYLNKSFPIVLTKINNKKIILNDIKYPRVREELIRSFVKKFNKQLYEGKKRIIKLQWQEIEKDFFYIFHELGFKIKDCYYCYVSLYGPEGQFQYPNIIDIRAATNRDIAFSSEIIAHELIHLAIYKFVKKLSLGYEQIEGIVDLYFKTTPLNDLFPRYKLQDGVIHNKSLFNRLKKLVEIG